ADHRRGHRAAGYWFLWVRCPACRTINTIDLRVVDRHPDAAVSSLIPALSCRSCRPNAPFAELVRLSRTSIADEMRERTSSSRAGRVKILLANSDAGISPHASIAIPTMIPGAKRTTACPKVGLSFRCADARH